MYSQLLTIIAFFKGYSI